MARPRSGWVLPKFFATFLGASLAVCAHGATVQTQVRTTAASPKSSATPARKSAPAIAATSKRPTRTSPRTYSRTSRRARLARARAATAARARQAAAHQREVERAELKRGALANIAPQIRAAAAIVFNPATGVVMWEEHSREQRSIASLTKLMTAVVFLADEPDLTQVVEVTKPDVTNASFSHLRAGDQVELGELLHLMLIASDNGAARVLARTSDGSTPAFVQRMNDMAQQLGLTSTHYDDPTGLDPNDVSTAYDISHLISFAASDVRIGPIIRTETYNVQTASRVIPIHSTNKLLGTDVDVRGGKTGFINKAGYCLATLLQIPQGSQIAVVVLGAGSSSTRFWDARYLFNWAGAQSPTAAAPIAVKN
jgi:D-alanyl-D-alanine endopeptidase (penicillin-binding protein 7)